MGAENTKQRNEAHEAEPHDELPIPDLDLDPATRRREGSRRRRRPRGE